MGHYNNATICLNGHVVSKYQANYQKFCSKCGKETYSKCPECNSPIHGKYEVDGIVDLSGSYNRPDYDRKHGSGVAENHYPTMSIEEICALPVSELAAKDSTLFLWATFPQLNEAFRVIDAWGFKYKTLAFLWLKQNRKADSWFYGMGFWTRSNAEVCLLATRGRPKRQCAGIHQFVISHIEQHSKKPDEVRDKIVKLMGDQPRVELFARQKTPGWDVWGNEVNCTLTMPERKG